MSKKWSSYKEAQLMTENWRKFLSEDPHPQEATEAVNNLIKNYTELLAEGTITKEQLSEDIKDDIRGLIKRYGKKAAMAALAGTIGIGALSGAPAEPTRWDAMADTKTSEPASPEVADTAAAAVKVVEITPLKRGMRDGKDVRSHSTNDRGQKTAEFPFGGLGTEKLDKIYDQGQQGVPHPGNSVTEWQNFLVSQGLLQPKTADGDFGPATHRATVAYQQSKDLEPSGEVADDDLLRAASEDAEGIKFVMGDYLVDISAQAAWLDR